MGSGDGRLALWAPSCLSSFSLQGNRHLVAPGQGAESSHLSEACRLLPQELEA